VTEVTEEQKRHHAHLETLKRLREPFPASEIGKLPKGGIFLDFVGHGFLTARFLDVDPLWSWEPFALDANGLPLLDESGGLWIRLTIAGVTRIGYGDASGKKGPNAIKEAIGDALRNAGMRFGAALELWCKGDPDAPTPPPPPTPMQEALEELGDLCAGLGLSPTDVSAKFFAIHKVVPRGSTPEVVREFMKGLSNNKLQEALS
jgi:hypothetical protein